MPDRWSLRGAYRQQQSASRKLQTLVAHAEGVTCVKIGPRSGQILASGGEDGKLNLWRVGRTACLQSIQVAKRAVQCVAFDADENVAAVGSRSGSVKLLALNAGGKTRCRLTGHRAECTSTAFHPLGNVLGSGGQDTDVRVWDIRTRGCVRTFAEHEDSISCLAFSPDGKWVASGSEDRTVKLWDLQAGKLLHEFAGHRGGISAVRFHPDEFWLATGSKDGTVRYWDLETFRQVGATPTEHGQAIRQIAFLDTASQADEAAPHSLVCASDNGLRVWSLQPTRGISAEPIAWGSIQDAQITRDKNGDQRMIACALKDRTMVTVWSVDMNALVQDETDDHGDEADADDACNVEEFINDDIIVRAPAPRQDSETIHSPRERCTPRDVDPRADSQRKSLDDDDDDDATHEKEDHAVVVEDYTSDEDFEALEEKQPRDTKSHEKVRSSETNEPLGHRSSDVNAGNNALTIGSHRQDNADRPKDLDFSAERTEGRAQTSSKKEDVTQGLAISEEDEDEAREEENCGANNEEKNDGSAAAQSERRREPRTRKPPRSREGRTEQENARPNRERRLVSQWAAHEGPLDISYSDFSRGAWSGVRKPVESRTVRADAKVHVTEEVMKEHAKFKTVMQERLDELERILSIWRDNEPTRALESLEAVGNPSVTYDFFRCVNFRNGQSATLDICAAALPVLVSLGESKFEVHIKSLLATGKFLFDSFAPMISATLDHHRRSRRQSTRSNVDISREERVHKCRRCARGFRLLVAFLSELLSSAAMDNMARTKAEATNLHAKLDKFLAEISPDTPGHPSPPRLDPGAARPAS